MKKIFLAIFLMNILICNSVFAYQSYNLTFESTLDNTEMVYSTLSTLPVDSNSVIVLDRKTLIPLYEKNAYQKTAMASTTKILTCILALENSKTSDIVTVSKKASSVSGSTLGLNPNTKISMNDLLYGLMLRSGNDCAIAIAEHISGSVENFSTLMNQKAFELGLLNSNFISPHGLDNENHFTTAYDLSILTNYALNNSTFRKIVSTKTTTIAYNNSIGEISNTNELLGKLDGVYGVKTGFTFEAGRCLVSACKRNDLDIIVVVLGSDTKSIRTKDSKNLINYIFDNYEYIDVSYNINDSFDNFQSYFNKTYKLEKTCTIPQLSLEKIENYSFPILKGDSNKIKTKIYTITTFNPFISLGNIVGKIEVYYKENLLCYVNVFLENKLMANTWDFYFRKILSFYK